MYKVFTYMLQLSQCVVRKPVSANPGLKVNRSIYVFCINLFASQSAYVLCSFRLFKFKTEA